MPGGFVPAGEDLAGLMLELNPVGNGCSNTPRRNASIITVIPLLRRIAPASGNTTLGRGIMDRSTAPSGECTSGNVGALVGHPFLRGN